MKYLVLDASHKEARNLASCLLGSLTDGNMELLAVSNDYRDFGLFVLGQPWDNYYGQTLETICLPIDTIKLCPWMAMKYAVGVRSYYHGSGDDDPSSPVFGSLQMSEDSFMIDDGTNVTEVEDSSIWLDLTPIERGEVQGVRIKEVEE